MALVLFLHGTSSSGKSSIARSLQEQYVSPLLHFGIDTLLDMLPQASIGDDEQARNAYYFDMHEGRVRDVILGPYAKRLICATVPVVEQILACNNNLVVDEILSPKEDRTFLADYAQIFDEHDAYFIKVDCPLEVLEQREKERKNRHHGIARLQYNHIHQHGFDYDFTVNTQHCSPDDCARQILSFIKANPKPSAFSSIRANTPPSVGV